METGSTSKTERWGGARPNAGRPPVGTIPMQVRLRPHVADEFRRRAKEQHLTLGGLIEQLLNSSAR